MMASLADQYRPRSWAEVVGQEKALAKIETIRPRGLTGRGWWITGASGTGKTTIARLLAADIAPDWATEEVDAHALTPLRIDELEHKTMGRPIGGGCWAIICNEAHGLSRPAVRRLLTLFDRLPDCSAWIFTTTVEGQTHFEGMDDGGPLLSRCVKLALSRQGLAKPFAALARAIAQQEGLDGQSEERYLRLVQDSKNNMRAVLQAIEAGDMLQ